jgi:hypothetical protein
MDLKSSRDNRKHLEPRTLERSTASLFVSRVKRTSAWSRAVLPAALALAAAQSVALAQSSLVRIGINGCQEPDASSRQASASGNGLLIAFASSAKNMVTGDGNAKDDVFLYDVLANTRSLLSVTTLGVQGNDNSDSPSLDQSGLFVAFASSATNLVTPATAGRQIFLLDRTTGLFTLVSHNVANPAQSGNGDSAGPAISADGQWVAFYSYSSDLVSGDTNGFPDAFVYQVSTGAITRVSVGNGPVLVQANNVCYPRDPKASPDISVTSGERGVLVAFQSLANNLVTNDVNNVRDVFLRDVGTSTTTLISVNTAGVSGNNASSGPDISRYAQYVAFLSDASDLITGDTNAWTDILVRDLFAATTTRVSVTSTGAQCLASGPTPAYEYMPMVSYSGLYVSFDSDLKALTTNEIIQKENVFVRFGATTTAVSINTSGKTGNADSRGNALAQDETNAYPVSLQSVATDLISMDTNGFEDVFTPGTPFTYVNSCFGDGSGTLCPCGNTGALHHGCQNAQMTGGGTITAFGDASVSHDTLALQVNFLPPATQVLFYQGTLPFGPGGAGVQFGDGLRCVGGTITRLATKAAAGSATYSVCSGDVPIHTQGVIPTSGGSYYYQGWYRQAVMYCAPGNFNLTDVVHVVWAP